MCKTFKGGSTKYAWILWVFPSWIRKTYVIWLYMYMYVYVCIYIYICNTHSWTFYWTRYVYTPKITKIYVLPVFYIFVHIKLSFWTICRWKNGSIMLVWFWNSGCLDVWLEVTWNTVFVYNVILSACAHCREEWPGFCMCILNNIMFELFSVSSE